MAATARESVASLRAPPAGRARRGREALHPALEWARSGAMALTGPADGTPRLAPGPLAARARDAVAALARLAGSERLRVLDGGALLGERAALAGLARRGAVSPGGSCRLLRAADGWIAASLARPDDARLLPAWLGEGEAGDPWRFVAERVTGRGVDEIVARARLLGLPVAPAAAPGPAPPPWLRVAARGPRAARAGPPRVIDLSSLWAGPLCTHLLALAGAQVVKVESTRRPDGARFGPRAFFDLLNAGKRSVALDLAAPEGRAALARLVARADVVVESARPRALRQLGIDAAELVERIPGLTWLSITGYGRGEPEAGWVAFGDDAACAAGLAVATGDPDAPLFCGDAVADPLAGIHAALAAWSSWREGGGALLDVSLRDATAWCLGAGDARDGARVERRGADWAVVADGRVEPVAPPRARRPQGRARALGADTRDVLREAGLPC